MSAAPTEFNFIWEIKSIYPGSLKETFYGNDKTEGINLEFLVNEELETVKKKVNTHAEGYSFEFTIQRADGSVLATIKTTVAKDAMEWIENQQKLLKGEQAYVPAAARPSKK